MESILKQKMETKKAIDKNTLLIFVELFKTKNGNIDKKSLT